MSDLALSPMCPTKNFSVLTMLQKCRETALQWHLHLLKSVGIQESLLFHIGGARMSQEVSKRLVNGLQPQYTPYISRLQPIC